MPKSKFMGAASALLSLLCALSIQAQEPAEAAKQAPQQSIESLEEQSRKAFADGNAEDAYAVNLQLHERRPYNMEYMVNVVRAAGLQDLKTPAYEMMLTMQRQGLSHDFNQTDDTLAIRRTEVYQYINDLMVEAGKPAGEASLAFKLPGAPADYQAIAWDSSRGKFLVGTAKQGMVLAVADDGTSEVLLQANSANGMWSVNGLAVDPKRNRLWISSAASEKFEAFMPTDRNTGALFEFNLKTLELVEQYFLPIDAFPHELGTLALTDDGHVYVIDRALPVVYRKKPDGDRLEAFVGSQEFVAFSDLAAAPDNSRLFVVDRVKGILVLDPVAEHAAMLAGPDNLNLGGIEGIEYVDGHLYIVQPGIQPQRLMRLELGGSGSAVESVAPMAVAITEFDGPGIGTVRDDALYYFANPKAENSPEGLLVMRTELDAGKTIVPPDVRKFNERVKKNKP